MLKRLLHAVTRQMEQRYNYNAEYLHAIINKAPIGALRFFALPWLSQFHGKQKELWAGASLASTLDGDCGSCAELTIKHALEIGVDRSKILACLRSDFEVAGAVGLGFRFAQAVIENDPLMDELRLEIVDCHGDKALVAASFAAATARVYPTIKKAMGFGGVCELTSLVSIIEGTQNRTTDAITRK